MRNLVATNTREGEVFAKLLAKIEEQRAAYGGKVFDVRYLEDPFSGTDLGAFISTGVKGDWPKMWARGREPF